MIPREHEQIRVFESISLWAGRLLPDIRYALNYERESLAGLHIAQTDDFPRYLNTRWRNLSEMPLCRAVVHIEPPYNFVYVSGSVRYRQRGAASCTSHAFFADPALDTVLCLTSGQFADISGEHYPGKRIEVLQQRFSAGIYHMGEGIFLLYGARSDIRLHLGLEYNST